MTAGTQAVAIDLVFYLDEALTDEESATSVLNASREASELYCVDGDELMVSLDDQRAIAVQPHLELRNAGPSHVGDLPPALDEELCRKLSESASEISNRAGSSTTARVDQRALVPLLREAMDIRADQCIVITDRPIVPPTNFRYLIWDAVTGGVVVSIAALDPRYWGERGNDGDRLRILRRRTRAALCSVLGQCLGLIRCENPFCFLYLDVDSVLRLDDFKYVGPEHDIEVLTGLGFEDQAHVHDQSAIVHVGQTPV